MILNYLSIGIVFLAVKRSWVRLPSSPLLEKNPHQSADFFMPNEIKKFISFRNYQKNDLPLHVEMYIYLIIQ